jgi:hypothetical protein
LVPDSTPHSEWVRRGLLISRAIYNWIEDNPSGELHQFQVLRGFGSRRSRRYSDSTPRLAQTRTGNLHIGLGPDLVKTRFHRRGFVILVLQL